MKAAIRRGALAALLAATAGGAAGCGDVDDTDDQPLWYGYYATEVVEFEPGEGAGYNQDRMPDVVLGPPESEGDELSGALEVVSLGDGGEIVVGFGDAEIVDGPGDDFVVYENPFFEDGDPDRVWADLGEVSVSVDGQQWHAFECDYTLEDDPPYEGCAGWTPTLRFDPDEQVPPDPEVTGGDAFDLSEVGVDRASYVRIRDVWGRGAEPTTGFDLDGVGIVNGDVE